MGGCTFRMCPVPAKDKLYGTSHVVPTSVPPGGKNEDSYLRISSSYGVENLVNKDFSLVSSRHLTSETI